MSLDPIWSSVGSRSSHLHLALAGDERRNPLRSSWISRLHLHPLPLPPPNPRPAAADSLTTTGSAGPIARKHAVSTLKSGTPTPAPNLHPTPLLRPRPGSFPRHPSPSWPADSEETEAVTGFGPFRFRAARKPYGLGCDVGRRRVFGKGNFPFFRTTEENIAFWEGRKLSRLDGAEDLGVHKRVSDGPSGFRRSPFFQFRPPRIAGRVDSTAQGSLPLPRDNGLVGSSSREEKASFADCVDASRSFRLLFPNFPPPNANTCIESLKRRRDAPYHVVAADMCPERSFRDPQEMHLQMVPGQTDGQVPGCMNQNEEPFSFWNMGRLRRTNTISSASPNAGFPHNLSRKRSPDNTSSFIISKSRKLGGN